MATLVLAPALARWLTAEPSTQSMGYSLLVGGATVRAVLEELFQHHPHLRGYLVDERGALRHHVVAFVDNQAIADKQTLATPVEASSEIYLFQALSGG